MNRAFETHGFWILTCPGCGHQSAEVKSNRDAHIAQVYSDDYFSGGGAGYENYLEEAVLLRERGRTYGRLINQYTKPGKMLDVGAAAGLILQGFQDIGWAGSGVEPNARMAQFGRDTVGVKVQCCAFEQFQAEAPLDLVSIIQVIAHFKDPDQAVGHAASLLKPGGLLLIETWDRQSFAARIFGKSWHEYSPPSVLHWFSKDGLKGLAARHGMAEVATGRAQRSIQAGHAVSLLRHKLEASSGGRVLATLLGLVPKGLTVPYPGDDLFWAIYRKAEKQ